MKRIFSAIVLALFFSLPALAQAENPSCVKTGGTGGIVEAGQPMKFVVTVSGRTDTAPLEYIWTVSNGTIASGQGTCAIVIDTTGLANGTNITATVTVKGLPEHCPNTASETGSVTITEAIGEPLDRFGKLPDDEVKARVDALFVALGNYPNAQGYIIVYGTDREIAARQRQIQKAISFRKYDPNRVTVVSGGASTSGEVWTVIWIVPPGAKLPKP